MMKGRVLFVLLLHVALASTLSGCRTADVVGGQAAHRAALQALSSRSCKIILEEVYTPSDRPEKLRAQQVTGSYLIIKGDKMLAYLTREDNQCFVQASKVYMAGNFSFKGRILPLSEK